MSEKNYLDILIANCQAAKKAVCIKDFILTNGSELEGINSAIYIIREIDGDSQITFEAFKRFKQEQKEKKERNKKNMGVKEDVLLCPKLNKPSEVLYVGSSIKKLKNRLNQHIKNTNNDTYALRLQEWFSGQYEVQIKVYNVTRDVLQLIEDNLSFDLNPAFGKKGSNNKL
ncbi:TPA: GIY-YIG nuclease family protein [Acinetobacter baumannii]|nr:GIY-YIG nuclease family protein [Acinetobacter baumannii]HDR2201233.1 GIY-YIG nuclease family protein [Acinetobacter baumannii]